jgi:hypothetical protein
MPGTAIQKFRPEYGEQGLPAFLRESSGLGDVSACYLPSFASSCFAI